MVKNYILQNGQRLSCHIFSDFQFFSIARRRLKRRTVHKPNLIVPIDEIRRTFKLITFARCYSGQLVNYVRHGPNLMQTLQIH